MGWQSAKVKLNIKLGMNRLKLVQKKKAGEVGQKRAEVAALLKAGKEESARIRVEHVIREELLINAMELVEVYMDLLGARFTILDGSKNLNPDIGEAVSTITYAAHRIGGEIPELKFLGEQFATRYGKDWAKAVVVNADASVNHRVVTKMATGVPEPAVVIAKLEEIAKEYKVDWSAPDLGPPPVAAPPPGRASTEVPPELSPGVGIPQAPSASGSSSGDAPAPPAAPAAPARGEGTSSDLPDFDELQKRFDELRNNS